MSGTIAPGVAISQDSRLATLYVRRQLPDTILAASLARGLREIIDAPLLADGRYVVEVTRHHRCGCSFDFSVPQIPLAEWIRCSMG